MTTIYRLSNRTGCMQVTY